MIRRRLARATEVDCGAGTHRASTRSACCPHLSFATAARRICRRLRAKVPTFCHASEEMAMKAREMAGVTLSRQPARAMSARRRSPVFPARMLIGSYNARGETRDRAPTARSTERTIEENDVVRPVNEVLFSHSMYAADMLVLPVRQRVAEFSATVASPAVTVKNARREPMRRLPRQQRRSARARWQRGQACHTRSRSCMPAHFVEVGVYSAREVALARYRQVVIGMRREMQCPQRCHPRRQSVHIHTSHAVFW